MSQPRRPSWLKALTRSLAPAPAARRHRRGPLRVECLEGRITPAAYLVTVVGDASGSASGTGAGTSGDLGAVTFASGAALTVTQQPAGVPAGAGPGVTLSVGVGGGAAPYRYQWATGSPLAPAPIAGATGPSYTATPAAETTYFVVVTDALGAVVVSATVTVVPPVPPPSNVFLDGSGNLVFRDLTGTTADAVTLTLTFDGTRYTLTSAGPRLFTTIPGATGSGGTAVAVPAAAVAGGIILSGEGGNDTLTATYGASPFAHRVTLDGGGDDLLKVTGAGSAVPALTINGGADDDRRDPRADLTFAPDAGLDIDLQDDAAPGVDRIDAVGNYVLSGTGAATLRASWGVALGNGGLTPTSLVTANGAVVVEGNQQAVPTTGSFTGVELFFATVRATGTGGVTVRGRGGNVGADQFGVTLLGSDVRGGTAGVVAVEGTGGASGEGTIGVVVSGNFSESWITSAGADVRVTGSGGGTGEGAYSVGVVVGYVGRITSGGGAVTVTGTGGTAGGGFNTGVLLSGIGQISSGGGGAVTVEGTSGSDSGGGSGVYVNADPAIWGEGGSSIGSGGGPVRVTAIGTSTGPAVFLAVGGPSPRAAPRPSPWSPTACPSPTCRTAWRRAGSVPAPSPSAPGRPARGSTWAGRTSSPAAPLPWA